MKSSSTPDRAYRFQLLRYAPNVVSGEFYNVAVVLFDEDGRIVDARFATDFRRMQCHPAVEAPYLEALRAEFEEHRLLGEGFSEYFLQLAKNLSNTLELSEQSFFHGGDPAVEMDRLMRTFVQTPAPLADSDATAPAAGSRRAVREAVERAFEEYRLFAGHNPIRRNEQVRYGEGRMRFTFDFAYTPAGNGRRDFVHAIGASSDFEDASKVGLAFARVRDLAEQPVGLTAVLDPGVQDDARGLLRQQSISLVGLGETDALARRIRAELGR